MKLQYFLRVMVMLTSANFSSYCYVSSYSFIWALVTKGVSTIEANEAAASVILANSYMYSQLPTLHRVTTTYTVRHWPGLVYTRSSKHARSYGYCLYYSHWWSSSLLKWEISYSRKLFEGEDFHKLVRSNHFTEKTFAEWKTYHRWVGLPKFRGENFHGWL